MARSRVLPLVALLCGVAVLVTALRATDRPATGDRSVGAVSRVGVADGDSIPGYLRASSAELAALLATPGPTDGTGEAYALVSFTDYLRPQQLTGLLGPVAVAEVVSRVPLPQRQTEIVRIPALRVPQDVLAGMAELAGDKDREAATYRDRAAAPGADTEPDQRQVYASGAEVAAAEATAYRAGCACVYAAVVRADPAGLAALAARPGVRAVDPAPEVQRLDRAVFTPPLPEQTDVVRPPADSGLPADPVATTRPSGATVPSGAAVPPR